MKKYSNLSVSIKQKKKSVGRKGFLAERKLLLFKKNIIQKTFFNPKKKSLTMHLISEGKIVGILPFKIRKSGNLLEANLGFVRINKEFQKKGLYAQMLTEAEYILKKTGVNYISFEAIDGITTLKKLGYDIKSSFGTTRVWKKLNE